MGLTSSSASKIGGKHPFWFVRVFEITTPFNILSEYCLTMSILFSLTEKQSILVSTVIPL